MNWCQGASKKMDHRSIKFFPKDLFTKNMCFFIVITDLSVSRAVVMRSVAAAGSADTDRAED